MASKELIIWISGLLGGSAILVLLGMVLAAVYPNLKLIIADIFRLFGFVAKWIRKASVASEFEGSLNSIVKEYNTELVNSVLPSCDVRWITDANQHAIVEPGKIIVKLSFSQNHDVNFYNATSLYVREAVIPRAKAFLGRQISRAIDLQVVSDVLRKARRSALSTFNEKFPEETYECRETFFRLEEIESKGFFRRILLSEYHFFGEAIGERVSRDEYVREAEKFLDWLYLLATREADDQTVLKFFGEHIKVGVLLVAREETYEKYGLDPYMKRAHAYASDGFSTIYLISRGYRRGKITKTIASELINLGYCEKLSAVSDLTIILDGQEAIITCIPIRLDLFGVVQAAWTRLKEFYENEREVAVKVRQVVKDQVLVDAYGLRVEMELRDLSELEITDARRYFRPEQTLSVRISEINEQTEVIRFSNVHTVTDPKKLVDEFAQKAETAMDATVVGYSNFDGHETGLFVQLIGTVLRGYIPRKYASRSRFIELSSKYLSQSIVRIRPLHFDVEHNSYLCTIEPLVDPWTSITKYQPTNVYRTIIRQITEKYLTCELEEGVEGTVHVEEVSWTTPELNALKIKEFKVGDSLQVKLLNIDVDRRYVSLSVKRVGESPIEQWFYANRDRTVEAKVLHLRSNGVLLECQGDLIGGFLPIKEIGWTYCESLERILSPGQLISVKPILYDSRFNSITVSYRAAQRNDYENFKQTYDIGL